MKQLVFLGDHTLNYRDMGHFTVYEYKVAKIPREAALGWASREHIDTLIQKYAPLAEGEMYEGYVAIAQPEICGLHHNDICFMRGYFKREATADCMRRWVEKNAPEDIDRYDFNYDENVVKSFVCRYRSNIGEINGAFWYVYTFADCRFERSVEEMAKAYTGLGGVAEYGAKVSNRLRRKVIKAIVNHTPLQLSDTEYYVLKWYLGAADMRRFFVEEN